MIKIPVYRPSLTGNEKKYVDECLDSSWISSKGKFIGEFESKFAQYVNSKHAVSVSNGTVALHVALLTLGVGPGDEVIVPTLTYIASVNAITYTGAKPVFVDSLEDTWQMDPKDVEQKITPRTKAIMVVHLYGQPADLSGLSKIAKKHDIKIIEDAAEAFGSLFEGKQVGTFGELGTFSFFGNKTITTGEGGMVITDNDSLAELATHIKGQGLAKDREYWHNIIGYNYRMTNICAAIGLAQLEQADKFIAKKRKIADWYQGFLSDTPVVFHKETGSVKHSYWMSSILVPEKNQRDQLRKIMAEQGIETRPLFFPIHTMPMYQHLTRDKYPVAEDLADRGINLPSYPELTKEDTEFVSETIKDYFGDKA